MPIDDYWRFELGHEAKPLPIDGHVGAVENQTLGGGYSFTVWLTERSNSPAGAWPGAIDRYRTLDRMQDYAGKFALHELTSGRVAYTETHGGSQSNLVGLFPPADCPDRFGGWYLLTSMTDQTVVAERLCQLELELTFAAALADYPNHATAVADLEADGI